MTRAHRTWPPRLATAGLAKAFLARVLLSAAGALLWSGCPALDLGTSARRDLAAALECASAEVEMEQVGEYRYHGAGCGREATVACTASALEPHCLVEGTRSFDADPDDEPDSTDALPDIEQVIRGGLDARREDVLACVGRDRVGVRASYTPEGIVSLALQGELAGTAEERCVQQVLEGVRVRATGEEGVVIHLVD